MEAGIVWVNCSQPCFVQAPWGGIKVGRGFMGLGFGGFAFWIDNKLQNPNPFLMGGACRSMRQGEF